MCSIGLVAVACNAYAPSTCNANSAPSATARTKAGAEPAVRGAQHLSASRKASKLWLLQAPVQHRQEAQSVALDVRDGDAPAQTIRILHDQGSDFSRCAGECGRIPGQCEERFASGGESEVAIGGLRPQRMAYPVRLRVPVQHQTHLQIHGAAPKQRGGWTTGPQLFEIAPMQVGAEAEDKVELDVWILLNEAAQERLAEATLGSGEQSETSARHFSRRRGSTGHRSPGRSWASAGSVPFQRPTIIPWTGIFLPSRHW